MGHKIDMYVWPTPKNGPYQVEIFDAKRGQIRWEIMKRGQVIDIVNMLSNISGQVK